VREILDNCHTFRASVAVVPEGTLTMAGGREKMPGVIGTTAS
jgi:hypothetical protein